MKTEDITALTEDEVRSLDLRRVDDYLQSQGWRLRADQSRQFVKLYQRDDNRVLQVIIPAIDSLDDYTFVLARNLGVVSQYEQRSIHDLYRDILFFVDDVFEVSDVSADTANGTVAIPRADHLFDGIRKTLVSTAHLEINPRQHYSRQQRADAELFLSRCRLGQTRRGSYVMTVTCPLNALPLPAPTLFFDQNERADLPFTRRVTSRLMSSVELLTQCAEDNDTSSATQSLDTDTLISTNLCDALLRLSPDVPGASVKIGVRWAKKQPLPDSLEPPSAVTLKHDHRPFLEAVRVTLRGRHVPETSQVFFGRVDSLAGDTNEEGQREGTAIFQVTDEEQSQRRIRVFLSQVDHHTAIEAYEKNWVVSFRGVLRVAGGDTYRLDEYTDFRVLSLTPSSPERRG